MHLEAKLLRALAFVFVLALFSPGRELQAQTFSVLYSFTGQADGGNSTAGLVRDAAGNIFGTTRYGGDLACFPPDGCGTIFKLDTTGNIVTVHSFSGSG